jgi:predicted AlkP superfamily phosphohydrolase/phosphomutase
MSKSRLILSFGVAAVLFLSFGFACRSGVPEQARAERVVMVSYDGVGADLARQWRDQGVAVDPDGLTALVERGFSADRLRMASPTLTAVNHAALSSGRLPSDTGIVSNTFHRPDTPIAQSVWAFTASSEADTLWTAARRSGIRVASLLWPGIDAGALDRIGDYGVLWPGTPLAASEILELEPMAAGTTGELMSKDGVQPLVWPIEVALSEADEPTTVTFEVATYDATPDDRPRYDAVAGRRLGDDGWQLAGEREWFELRFQARAADDLEHHDYGMWSKALYLDRTRGGLRLYRGQLCRLRAYPQDFERRLSAVVGPWPGLPDDELLADWWLDGSQGIDLDTYLEQIERLDIYIDDIAATIIGEEDFRLLLAYHPTPDEYQHSSLLVDPDQWGFSPGKAVAAREGLKRLGRSVDRSIGRLWRALDPDRDALVVVSDHGHVPIRDLVNIQKVLADEGLLEVVPDGGRRRVSPTSPMAVRAHGASAHLHLNLDGREPGGVVSRAEAPELLARAAKALADIHVAGEPIVERIFKRSEAASIGLDHPNSGDLIAFLEPGFAFSMRWSDNAIDPSSYYGQHGHLAHHDAMCGMFAARGPGIPSHRRDEVEVTEVAPLVARWLGFELR